MSPLQHHPPPFFCPTVSISPSPNHHTTAATVPTTCQAGEGAAGVTFTPVRLAVDCWRSLWDTAERHGRDARGMALSMSSFARFKLRRGRWQRRRKAAVVVDTVSFAAGEEV